MTLRNAVRSAFANLGSPTTPTLNLDHRQGGEESTQKMRPGASTIFCGSSDCVAANPNLVMATITAVPKTTIDASTIDSTRLYGALGARYEFSKTFALAGSYIPIYFLPVDTQGTSKHDNYGLTSRSPSACSGLM